MRLFKCKRKVYTFRCKPLVLLFIVLFFVAIYLFVYNTCYSDTIKEKARVKANYVALSAVNKAVESLLSKDMFTENAFFVMNKTNDGFVSSVSINTKTVNLFKARFTQEVLEIITKYGREEILMSPFSSYGYTYVPFGIRIPVLVVPIEILSVDIGSDLISNGINQTLYRLNLDVKIAVKLLLPIGSESFEIQTCIPLVQTVIVGSVPNSYTNVEGVSDTGPDTILDIAS